MINLNDFTVDMEQKVNVQYSVYYSSKNRKWYTSFGSGSIYIDGVYFDYN